MGENKKLVAITVNGDVVYSNNDPENACGECSG